MNCRPAWIAPVAILSTLCAIGFSSYVSYRSYYRSKHNEAAECAVHEFGDKRSPLTPEEIKDWYKHLGVDINEPNARPSRSQLQRYIVDYKARTPE